mmetsp:Transcript_84187/g.243361  ORF Transcript_84187/g.243361 Transcript_84187/m.243361 type:complete len:231 (-) Transcript_84187:26-718(-)
MSSASSAEGPRATTRNLLFRGKRTSPSHRRRLKSAMYLPLRCPVNTINVLCAECPTSPRRNSRARSRLGVKLVKPSRVTSLPTSSSTGRRCPRHKRAPVKGRNLCNDELTNATYGSTSSRVNQQDTLYPGTLTSTMLNVTSSAPRAMAFTKAWSPPVQPTSAAISWGVSPKRNPCSNMPCDRAIFKFCSYTNHCPGDVSQCFFLSSRSNASICSTSGTVTSAADDTRTTS